MDDRGSIPGREKRFSLLRGVETGSEAHPASYRMGLGEPYPRGLSDRSVKSTTYLHLVPTSRMVALHLHFPIRLHGVVLNSLITETTLCFNLP
jgi:hypothetical protein